jgi:hypothetical protein
LQHTVKKIPDFRQWEELHGVCIPTRGQALLSRGAKNYFTLIHMKMAIFWDVASYSQVDTDRRF